MIETHTASDSVAPVVTTPCPKCRNGMVLACITPHPVNPGMGKHTFLCEYCNQTRSYVLATK